MVTFTEEIINGKLRFLCSELFSKCFSFFSIKPFEDVNSYTFASHNLLSLSSLQINLGVFKVFLVSVAAYGYLSFSFLILILSFVGGIVMSPSFGMSNTMSFFNSFKNECTQFTLSTSISNRYVKPIMLLNNFLHMSLLLVAGSIG